MNASKTSDLAYDAVGLLRFGPAIHETLPEAEPGEVVIRYGGWSFQDLRRVSAIARGLMWEQDWYHKYPWADEKLPVGIYRLHIPVLNSCQKNFAEQTQLLSEGEQPAPVVLVATALLAHCVRTRRDLLNSGYARCKEQTADGFRVGLYWRDGRLHVYDDWGDGRYDGVWLSSVRTS